MIQNLTTIGTSRETDNALDGFFAGTIDEVRIWNAARSQAQIQGSMNTEMTSPTANLVGRWGLDEGTGSAIADSSGNAVNGTTIASPAWVDGFNVAPPVGGANGLQFDGSNDYVTFGTALSPGRNAVHAGDLVQAGRDGRRDRQTGSTAVSRTCPVDREGSFRGRHASQRQHELLPRDRQARTTSPPTSRKTTSGAEPCDSPHHHGDPSERLASRCSDLQWQRMWRIYLDGVQTRPAERLAQRPSRPSIEHGRRLGTALEHRQALPLGFFQGVARRSRASGTLPAAGAQIQAAMGTQIGVPTAGSSRSLGMNETAGTNVPDTVRAATSTERRSGAARRGFRELRSQARARRPTRRSLRGADRWCFRSVGGPDLGRHGDRPRRRPDERDLLSGGR